MLTEEDKTEPGLVPCQNKNFEATESKKADLADLLVFPAQGFIYELWPTSNKIFELDIKNKSGKDLAVSVASSVQPKFQFKFAGDRKAPFESNFSGILDAEGKNKLFVQVATPESRSEMHLEASFQVNILDLGIASSIPVLVKVVPANQLFLPKICSSKAIILEENEKKFLVVNFGVIRSNSRSEYKIPIKNSGAISANCDFQIMSIGYMDDMHAFYIMPFRALIKPGDSISLTLGIKCNWKIYDKDEIDKRWEMRKLLNIKLADTHLSIVVPLCIRFVTKQDESE